MAPLPQTLRTAEKTIGPINFKIGRGACAVPVSRPVFRMEYRTRPGVAPIVLTDRSVRPIVHIGRGDPEIHADLRRPLPTTPQKK